MSRVRRNVFIDEPAGEFERAAFVVYVVRDDHVRTEASRSGDGSGHARAHLVQVSREGQYRSAGPEDVGGSRVRVALQVGALSEYRERIRARCELSAHLGGVQEEVGDATSLHMFILIRDVGEDNSVGDLLAGPLRSGLLEVHLAGRREAEKPQDRIRVSLQNGEPEPEDVRVDLRSSHM